MGVSISIPSNIDFDQLERDEIVRVATNNTYLSEIYLNKFAHPNYVKRIKK
jgi:hypothetical protein